jgi:hypothetical protein
VSVIRTLVLPVFLSTLLVPHVVRAEARQLSYGAFEVVQRVELPGTPEEIFDAVTGDISGWWDHTFSGSPARLFIEPEVGGGFWELFDEEGNGVRHAVVIGCDRGKMLRLEGPLGFAGYALSMVHTYEFSALDAQRTELKVTVHGAGELEEGWVDAVEGVWRHFIVEQLEPWVKAGKHLE